MEFVGIAVFVILFSLGMYFLTPDFKRDELIENDMAAPAQEVFFESVTEAQLSRIINLLETIASCLKFFVFVIVCWVVIKIVLFAIYGTAAFKLIEGVNQILK